MNFNNFLPQKMEAPPAAANNEEIQNPKKSIELPEGVGFQKDGSAKRAEPAEHKQPNPTTKSQELLKGQTAQNEAVIEKATDLQILANMEHNGESQSIQNKRK